MDSLIKLTICKLAADGIDSCRTPLCDRQRTEGRLEWRARPAGTWLALFHQQRLG